MKILYVCHRFPYPPKRGGKIRPFNMIRHLGEQGHQVTVASLARSDEEAEEGRPLADHAHEVISARVRDPIQSVKMVANLARKTPSSMGFFHSRELQKKIDDARARTDFDLIFVHCSSVAQYVDKVQGVAKILDFGDMDSQKWISYGPMKRFPLSLGYYLEGLKMQLAETELANRFTTCTATTKAELASLRGLIPSCHTGWFPNGVDADRFSPGDEPYDPDTVCFVGRMDYYPNQECMYDFVANTWPILRRKRPSAKMVIVGADPSPQVRALEKEPGVTVTGSVDKVQPYVQKGVCTVAPLNIARGTQNKILESLAMGVPVVSSTLAAAGVDCEPGEHMLVADSPTDYAQAVLRLMDDTAERKRFSEAGRARMLSHHDWGGSMKRLDKIIEETMELFAAEHARSQEMR